MSHQHGDFYMMNMHVPSNKDAIQNQVRTKFSLSEFMVGVT